MIHKDEAPSFPPERVWVRMHEEWVQAQLSKPLYVAPNEHLVPYVPEHLLAQARGEADAWRKCCAGFVGSTVRMAEQIWAKEKSQEWIKEKLFSHPSLVEFKELAARYPGDEKARQLRKRKS